MNDMPIIDFNITNLNKRRFLFFKRPKGTPIPKGLLWKCLCGNSNTLNENVDQFCIKCGNRLRLQENKEDNSQYFTTVIVTHVSINKK